MMAGENPLFIIKEVATMIRLVMFNILLMSAVTAMTSCGRATKASGGIVDNGNKDESPTVAHDSQNSSSPILAELKRVSIFGDEHSIEVPSNFVNVPVDDRTEAFSFGEDEVLRLSLVAAACQTDSFRETTKGGRLYKCGRVNGEYQWVVEAQNGQFIAVNSKLDEAVLERLVDTLD